MRQENAAHRVSVLLGVSRKLMQRGYLSLHGRCRFNQQAFAAGSVSHAEAAWIHRSTFPTSCLAAFSIAPKMWHASILGAAEKPGVEASRGVHFKRVPAPAATLCGATASIRLHATHICPRSKHLRVTHRLCRRNIPFPTCFAPAMRHGFLVRGASRRARPANASVLNHTHTPQRSSQSAEANLRRDQFHR